MHIGIIGSGQLAQMMAQAGRQLDMTFSFLAENISETNPVAGLGNIVILPATQSAEAVYSAMGKPDVITVDKESVNTSLLQALAQYCRVAPNAQAVGITQNRTSEKDFLNQQAVPTVGYASVKSSNEIQNAVSRIGYPVIIKSIEQGYDGKNQWRLLNEADLQVFLQNYPQIPVVVEQWVKFSAEVSMIGTRAISGEKVFYPLTENRHENGVLLTSKVPSVALADQFEAQAISYLSRVMDTLDYVGTMTMECFIVDGKLLVNELAPRVHNSGHWTLNGSATSQFENHLRAIGGLALGDTTITSPTGMLNLLGKRVSVEEIQIPDASLHWYNKDLKPGRKMGHINVRSSELPNIEKALLELEQQIYQS